MAGGYRKPSMPAPVSGPGRFARRTDGGVSQPVRSLSDAAYGEQATFRDIQTGAPMNASARTPQGGGALTASPQAPPVPLSAPTQRPDEPITSGVDVGPGVGSTALGVPQRRALSVAGILEKMLPNDPNGDVRALYEIALNRGW